MAVVAYALCALSAMACATLLFLAWRRNRSAMLWWSGICFLFLTLANIVLMVDFYIFPDAALWPLRHGLSLVAIGSLLYGLIFAER